MTDELVFYNNPMSRGRVVRWMLEEVGQPYRTEVLDYPAMQAPGYLQRRSAPTWPTCSRRPAWRRRPATAAAVLRA